VSAFHPDRTFGFEPLQPPRVTGTLMTKGGTFMLRRRLLAVVGTAAWLMLVPCTTVRADPLLPAKPWVLDYGETQCAAWREYGASNDPITLLIRPSVDGGTYELDVVKRRAAGLFTEEFVGSVDFGKGAMRATVLHYQNVPEKLQISQFRITSAQMAQARSALSITLELGNYQPTVRLPLQSMPDVLTRLEQCNADLRRYWNVGVNLKQHAKGDVRSIFTNYDYPDAAVRRAQQGTAQFLLFVDQAGSVAACHLVRPSGVPLLDAMGCIVIKQRAKFIPAQDGSGNPVRDAVATPLVEWRTRQAQH
jgi:hypothetical protein